MRLGKSRAFGWIVATLVFVGLAILLGVCLSRRQVDPRLWVGRWELVSLHGQDLVEGPAVTLRFYQDTAAGWTTCNKYSAPVDGFRNGVADWEGGVFTTDLACLRPELMAQEKAYLEALNSVVAYKVSLSSLTLMDSSGETVLAFRRRWIPRLLD